MRQNQGVINFNGFLSDLFDNDGLSIFGERILPSNWSKNVQNVPVNLSEGNSAFDLHVFVPGIAKEDIHLKVDEKILTISYEQDGSQQAESEDSRILKNEYQVKSFKRSFKLSEKIDAERISATHENGVLKIALPKKEAEIAVSRQIEIG